MADPSNGKLECCERTIKAQSKSCRGSATRHGATRWPHARDAEQAQPFATKEISGSASLSCGTFDAPCLVLERGHTARDDRAECEHRTHGQRGDARQPLADRAAQRRHAAKAHQHGADDVIADILYRPESFPAKG